MNNRCTSIITFNKKSSYWYKSMLKDTYYIYTDEKITDIFITANTKRIYANNLAIKQYDAIMKFIANNFDCIIIYENSSIEVFGLKIMDYDIRRKEPYFIKDNLLKILPCMIDYNKYNNYFDLKMYNVNISTTNEHGELNNLFGDLNQRFIEFPPILVEFDNVPIAKFVYIDTQNHSAVISVYNSYPEEIINQLKYMNINQYELKVICDTDDHNNIKSIKYTKLVLKDKKEE